MPSDFDAASVEPPATPQPTPPLVDAGGAEGRGLSIGENAGGGASGIPADFHFTYYVERMLALIESRCVSHVQATAEEDLRLTRPAHQLQDAPRQAEALQLAYFGGLTHDEIAGRMKMATGAPSSRKM